jgi:hypothetical protein
MASDPLRRRSEPKDSPRPKIWAEGGQRPPFDLRALGRASLHFAREGVAPLHGWAARTARRVAVNVKNGAGRVPAGKLGRAERFVPSHLRVAAWVKNAAAVFAHASATADPDVKRGNALVAEIEPHLWTMTAAPAPAPAPEVIPAPPPAEPPPVVLAEPMQPGDDPLAAIRNDLGDRPDAPERPADRDQGPPEPPGPLATGAIQVSGYGLGWLTSFAALPYGLAKAVWLHIKGVDLRRIGQDD